MLNSSGIGTYLQYLLPCILPSYKNVRFNLLGNRTRLQQSICAGYENITPIDCNSKVYSVAEQIELFRKIPPGTDLFWSPHYNIPLLPVKVRKRIVTIHDVYHLAFYDQLTLTQKAYAKLMLNTAVRISDRIITVSDFSRSEIIKYTGINDSKITVIHNGVDAGKFKPADGNMMTVVNDLREKFNLPEKFILYAGNVKPHKNLKRLLNAYATLLKRGLENYCLVIVGQRQGFITSDSDVFKILNDNSFLREKVFFIGHISNEDLPYFYNSASILAFPSLYEGFGLPPLEAMACGCPVVVSNAASLPEVCGDAACYVDPYNVESIAEGMYKVLTDESLRQSLIEK
ncbi:MAG: glycosyltransferase family 4 protein [Nitrospirae bacterium]|nr:glycosyltransferase family 4 protein [Nitrospirota bacterium]